MKKAQPSMARKPTRRPGRYASERRQQDEKPDDEAEGRPLDVAGGVPVERRLRDLLRQLGIVGIELRLDLLENSLLVFGKGHRFHFHTA